MKQQTPFEFPYELRIKKVCDFKIVTEKVGELIVTGVGYFNSNARPLDVFDRYSVDIDFVKWNGTDIKPVLEVMGSLDEIEEAAIRFFANKIENTLQAA